MEPAVYNTYLHPKLSFEEEESLLLLHNEIFYDSPWSREYLAEFLSDAGRAAILVSLSIGGVLSGFALGRFGRGGEKVFILCTMAVGSGLRGSGYGSEIMRRFLTAALENTPAEKVALHYRDSKNFKDFYAKIGFGNDTVCGSYKNGDPKHYMDISRSGIMKHIDGQQDVGKTLDK